MTYTGSDARIGTRLTVKIPPKLIKASATSPINSIVEGHVDLGITSVFSDKNVTFIPLFKDPARLIVPSNHPLASNDEISAESLDGCDLIYIPDIGDDVIQAVKKSTTFKSAFTI